MAVKIFLTGATGYIGGTVLDSLVKAHPEYEYRLLVRDEARAGPIRARYPDAALVVGRLEDAAVLEQAAAEADIVVRASALLPPHRFPPPPR
ncbi:hypothetical protein CDD83_2536 [Cordyceps sp. RAO-2017]|nr:hypothetical protein CDD83_2536 [Cordyceps sp. RAO-2017]